MRNKILASAFFVAVAFLLSCSGQEESKTVSPNPAAVNPETEISQDSLVKRGEYLIVSMGCDDCHSPKIMTDQGPVLDAEHRLSGYPAMRPLPAISKEGIKDGWILMVGDLTAAVGPWGVSYAANITPDPKTGIGNWTEAQFQRALREGKAKGLEKSRMLLPPMPWQNFRNLSDHDISAMYHYLKSIKPVENIVPEPKSPNEL